MSDLLEIEDVEGVGWVSNEIGGFLGALSEGALLDEGANAAERGNIRACGQELEKFAAGSGGRIAHHGGSF